MITWRCIVTFWKDGAQMDFPTQRAVVVEGTMEYIVLKFDADPKEEYAYDPAEKLGFKDPKWVQLAQQIKLWRSTVDSSVIISVEGYDNPNKPDLSGL